MKNEQMKSLETIYQENRIQNEANNESGIDFRTTNEEIWDAMTEYLDHYFNEGEWTLYKAMNEVLSMGLTNQEQIVAVKVVLLFHELGKRF